MKRILFLISLLYLSITLTGQTVQSSFNGYGNTSLVSGSGPNFVIGINGFTGSFNNLVDGPFLASDVLVGDVIWYDCTRFVITAVNSFSSTNMNVDVNVPSSDWALGVSTPLTNQRVAVIRELPGTVPVFPPTADGNGGALSGIDNALHSCMMTHYAKVTRAQIAEAEEIVFTSGTAPPDNSLATTDGYRLAKNSGGNGDLYLWDGSAWELVTNGNGSGANTITVMQTGHGFTLSASEPTIAVKFNGTNYIRADNTSSASLPSAYIVEIVDANYFKIAGESFVVPITTLTTNFYYLTSLGTLTSTPPVGIVFQVGVSVPNGSGQQRFRITGVLEAGVGGGGSGVPECSIEVTQVSPTLNVLDRVEWSGTAYVTVTTNSNLNSYVVVAKDGDDYVLATCGIYDNAGADGWFYGVEGSSTIQIVTPTACAPIEGHRTNGKLAIHILPTCTGIPSNTYTGGAGISITGSAPNFTIDNLGLLTTTNHLGDIAGVYNNLQIEAGAVGTNELASGSVTAAKINQMSATNGQVLKWNSTSQLWEPGTDNNTGSATIQEEGSNVVTSATTINFVGAGVTATGGGSTATITIPKGEISIWYDSTASGGSYRTVTIPSGVKSVKIQACGGGGGGAAGGHRLASNVSTGGGIGGHGGQVIERNFEFGTCADCIPSNVTLTYDIGAGGSGGAAKVGTGAALSGNVGSSGGSTTIKVNTVIFIKAIGGPGAPNCTTTGDGTPKIMIPSFYPSAPGNTGIPDESIGPGAGGYGGVNGAAGNAGGAGSGLSVTTAAGSNATASISRWHTGGNGGGGGTSGNAANGTAGGNGTQGSGGGGGGQVINSTASFTSGAGGNGGDGWVRFIFYY